MSDGSGPVRTRGTPEWPEATLVAVGEDMVPAIAAEGGKWVAGRRIAAPNGLAEGWLEEHNVDVPVFHFHLRLADGLEADEVGVPFASVEAAYLSVCESIPQISAELIAGGRRLDGCSYVIANGAGRSLMEVPFSELRRARAGRLRSPPAGQRPDIRRVLEEASETLATARSVSAATTAWVERSRAFVEDIRQRRRSVADMIGRA